MNLADILHALAALLAAEAALIGVLLKVARWIMEDDSPPNRNRSGGAQ